MISLRKTCMAVATAFALSMSFGAGPAAAQVQDQASVDAQSRAHNDYWCNPITNITPRNVVRSFNGAPVLQESSYPCPVAEAAPTPAPAPAAPQTFTVYFDFDRSFVRQDAVPVLEQALQTAESEDKTFALTGYTDTVGTAEYNMALSLRRAESVRSWLTEHGFPSNEISVAGRGFNDLAVPTGPNVREQLNRRVEIVLQ